MRNSSAIKATFTALPLIGACLLPPGHVLAADKSGVKPQVLSLPSGPGSIEGLGGAFEPQLNSGAASYSVPITMPPGRSGHAPDLRLVYSGGNGNGHVGLGWSLPLESIRRDTEKGQPGYVAGDLYVHSSGEELVPIADGTWRCENEASFLQIRRSGEGWEIRDRLGRILRLGETAESRVGKRQVAGGAPVAEVGTPFDSTFRWNVSSFEDTNGNRVEYSYSTYGDSGGELYLTEVRYNLEGAVTAGITFDLDGQFASVQLHYDPREDAFTDYRSGFAVRSGRRLSRIEVRNGGRATREYRLTYDPAQSEGADPRTVGSVPLKISLLTSVTQFESNLPGASSLPPMRFGYTRLHTGDVNNAPPSFPGPEDVDLNGNGLVDGSMHYDVADFPASLDMGESADLVDVDGDALPDVLQADAGSHLWYRNIDGRRFDPTPRTIQGEAIALSLQSARVSLGDFDGDGRSELIEISPGVAVSTYALRFVRSSGAAIWEDPTTAVIPPAMDFDFERADVRLADVDSDKRTDVIRSVQGSAWDVCTRRDYPAWHCASIDPLLPLDAAFGPPGLDRYMLVDMNGDRIQDIAYVLEGGSPEVRSISYHPGIGGGRFDREVLLYRDGTSSPEIFVGAGSLPDNSNLLLSDFTGDGIGDLAVVESGTVRLWVNLGGERWAEPVIYGGTPTWASEPTRPAIRVADINGNGSTDVAFFFPNAADGERLRVLDFAPGERVNQLRIIDNGLGRRTLIEYASSTNLYLAAGASGVIGTTGSPWTLVTPFPTQVVRRTVVTSSMDLDMVSGPDLYVTDFSYRDAYYDAFEREFRGFAFVKKIERGDAIAPTKVTRIWFHTGAPDGEDNDLDGATDERSRDGGGEEEALKGRILRQEETDASAGADDSIADGQQASNSTVFRRVSNSWRIRTLHAPTPEIGPRGIASLDERSVSFAFLAEELMDVPERRAQGVPLQLRKSQSYDDFGHVTREVNEGVVGVPGDERITRRRYLCGTDTADPGLAECACDEQKWMIDLLVQEEVADGFDNRVREIKRFYDGPDYLGQPICIASRGNLKREETWVQGSQSVDSLRNAHDQFGNVIGMLDPLGDPSQLAAGHLREMAFDDVFAVQPVQETIHVGGGAPPLVMTATWDLGFGVMTESVDFNGNASAYGYDIFGRLTSITKPGDTALQPTTLFSYRMVDPFRGLLYDYDRAGNLSLTQGVPVLASRVLTQARESSGLAGTFDSADYVDGMGRKLARVEEAETGFVVTDAVTFNARGGVRDTLQPYYSATFEYLLLGGGDASSLQYDGLGRELVRTHPPEIAGGPRAQMQTSYLPLRKIVVDELGNERAFASDGLDRLVQVEEVNRGQRYVTRYDYNAADSLTHITDAQSNVRTFVYDGLQRKTLLLDPDRGALSYFYDAASNLRETVDAKGQRISYAYDGVNRLLAEDYLDDGLPVSANRSPDVRYHYDAPKGPIDAGDGRTETATQTKGLLAWVEDPSGEEHLSYDARAREFWVVKSVAAGPGTRLVGYKTEMTYDALDRITGMTFPDGDRVGYEYNPRSLLERILGGPTGAIVASIDYTASGQMASCFYGNGVESSYRYDPRLRMRSARSARPGDPAGPLLDYAYGFDAASNIGRIGDLRPASFAPPGSERRNTQIFGYDDLYRLERVQYSYAVSGHVDRSDGVIQYAYDPIGNLLSQTSSISAVEDGYPVANLGTLGYAGGRTGRTGRKPNDPPGPHAVTTVGNGPTEQSLAYDPNGNVTSFEGKTLTWDFKDRLVAVESDALRAEYVYDYTDRRIQKRVVAKPATSGASTPPPDVTTYVNRSFEIRERDTAIKYVFNGEIRVARITGSLDPTAERVQRLRVLPGWNLLSLGVQAPDAATQLGLGAAPVVQAIYLWDPNAKTFSSVSPGGVLPAGSVVWLRATAEATLQVRGIEIAIPQLRATVSGAFLPVLGSVPFSLTARLSGAIDRAWVFDEATQTWKGQFTGPIAGLSSAPEFLSPGDALYVRATQPTDIAPPDAARAIQYYHQDHLGSSDVVADADGKLLESNALYPFGHPRSRYRPTALWGETVEPYLFTQKELDRETGLQYFEARYLSGATARFLSVDKNCISPAAGSLSGPQALNCYSYASNNPIGLVDPRGELAIHVGFFLGGAILNVTMKAASDYYRGERSSFGAYLGTAVSGGISGLGMTTPLGWINSVGAGMAGAAAGNITEQITDSIVDGLQGEPIQPGARVRPGVFSWSSFRNETVSGGVVSGAFKHATGIIKPSYSRVTQSLLSRYASGNIKNAKIATLNKMFGTEAVRKNKTISKVVKDFLSDKLADLDAEPKRVAAPTPERGKVFEDPDGMTVRLLPRGAAPN